MIELEVQVLAHTREGLLMDIGRVVSANGFTLQRQRLVPDPHGALLTLVVSGPPRRQRALDDALAGHERVISFEIATSDGGEMRPHFAASRPVEATRYVPAAPVDNVVAAPAVAAPAAAVVFAAPVASAPDRPSTPEPEEFPLLPPVPAAISAVPSMPVVADEMEVALAFAMPQPPPPPAPASPPVDPFVEIVPLPPDEAAIERLMDDVGAGSDRLMAALLQLDGAVEPGAREPTLQRAGQRLGAALARSGADAASMALDDAIEQVGLPALRALVPTDVQGGQLHIRQSPLCEEAGHSGCAFFTGLLEAALGPHVAAHEVSVFNVCCRAWGADECVLAISD